MRRLVDGSVVDAAGRVLYFSVERFVADICQGDCCFICGVSPKAAPFTDEHILPRWVLRKFGLFDRQVTLPNLTDFRYGQYTVPCCSDCNALMGERIERPVRELIEGGVDAVAEHLRRKGALLLFVWMALIFFKTHLRDRRFRFQLDRRLDAGSIAELYEWEELHHVHCVARSFYTRAVLAREAFGSFMCLAARNEEPVEPFDYSDLYDGRAVLVRLGEVGLLAVLNDSNAALTMFDRDLHKVTGPLTMLQLREVLAHLAYINTRLKVRPSFHSMLDPVEGYTIVARRPPMIELEADSREDFGAVLYACTQQIVEKLAAAQREPMLENIRRGRWSFLFDAEGKFIANL